ncbi:Uncharacterised protein [Bordetella pertussis]|nr:Uncharacterised protein [Bordetella pertussis]CFV95460.1 Uncharacterised protein [Bordetella pertussis]
MNGMTGATSTPTGTPACARVRTVCSRRYGAEARGSSVRAMAASSVVMLTNTVTSFWRARSCSRSRSRSTRAFLVTTVSGWRVCSSSSSMPRVRRQVRSMGW